MRKLTVTTIIGFLILTSACIPMLASSTLMANAQFHTATTSTIILNEGFEGAFPPANWSTTGHWGKSSCEAKTGTSSAWAEGAGGLLCPGSPPVYHADETSQLTYGPFSLSDAVTATLAFDAWLWSSLGDSFFWGASIDGSHFYGMTATNVFSTSWTGGQLFDLSSIPTLGDLRGQTNVWITFIWHTDNFGEAFGGAFVDNVVISKGGQAAPVTPTSTTTQTSTPGPDGTPHPVSYLPNVIRSWPPTLAPTLTPTPTRVNQPGNRAPQFPSPLRTSSSAESQYDNNGRLIGVVTTITVLSAATDADGDAITYSWSSSNGGITGNGLIGTWNRVLANGKAQGGTATITASDGRGGTAKADFVFP